MNRFGLIADGERALHTDSIGSGQTDDVLYIHVIYTDSDRSVTIQSTCFDPEIWAGSPGSNRK